MPRGGFGYLYRDIARSEDQLENLGANMGGVSKGIVMDLAGLLSTPQRARDAQRAKLAEAGAYLAPKIARERGITEDEALAEITGGVQEPEPGYKSIGRLLGLVDAPTGEPFNVRMGKLRGTAARMKDDDGERKAGMSSLGDLIEMSGQLEDPAVLRDAMGSAARRAGIGNIGDLKFKPAPYKSLWDYAGRTGKDPIELMRTMNAPRGGGGSTPRPTVYERIRDDLMSSDPRRRAVAERYMKKGGGKSASPMKDLVKAKFETDMLMDPGLRMQFDAELNALAQWKRAGSQGEAPPTPTLDRYAVMTGEELGDDGVEALVLEPDDDVGGGGEGVYTFEDHDDILGAVEAEP